MIKNFNEYTNEHTNESSNEESIKYSNMTNKSTADKANSIFGQLLDIDCKFTIGITPMGMKRLQIRKNGKMLFEFSPPFNRGINMQVELTKDKVENAVSYIKKYTN